MTHTLQIPYDDSVLLEVSLQQQDFEKEATFLLAAKLFELGRLSSGSAAQLCGGREWSSSSPSGESASL